VPKDPKKELIKTQPLVSDEVVLSIKAELLEEIEKQDELRKEILESLRIRGRGRNFFNHPAMLLIIGFFLTSVVGTILTSSWQERDKRKQDARLLKELTLKNKTEVINETSALILQTYSASSDMIAVFQRGEIPEIRQKVLLERMDYWQKASREWRQKYPILERRLKSHFRDTEIHKDFLEVITLRGRLGIEIPNWRSAIYREGWKLIDVKCNEEECAPKCELKDCQPVDCTKPAEEKYFFNRVRCTNIHNEEMKRKALAIIDRMMNEVRIDENNNSTETGGLFARLGRWLV
jgi:hypothetical protein